MRACCAWATGCGAALDNRQSGSLGGKAEGQCLEVLCGAAAPRHPRHMFELRDGEVGCCAGVVRAHELGHARSDLGAEARAVEDAVMADVWTGEVHLVLRRNPGAQIKRGATLSATGDVVLLSLHRHQHRAVDGAKIDAPAARSHKPTRHEVL